MSNPEEKHYIVPYRTFLLVLLVLITFTLTSIAATSYKLGPLTVVVALLLAACKTTLILTYFMHLKYDVRMFAILVSSVLALIGVVILITFLDYLYR